MEDLGHCRECLDGEENARKGAKRKIYGLVREGKLTSLEGGSLLRDCRECYERKHPNKDQSSIGQYKFDQDTFLAEQQYSNFLRGFQ